MINKQEEPAKSEPEVSDEQKIVSEENNAVKNVEITSEETEKQYSEDNVNNEDDFNLNLETIKFEPRQERREGSRRRGYRRSHDRNIVTRAQQDAVSIKETAKKDGYNEGIEQAKQDIQAIRENFAQFFNYKQEVFEKVSACIMDVAVEIASKILIKEVEADKDYILPIIKNVLEEINKTENKIVLKVMPKDVEIVRDRVNDIFSGNYFEAKISVVPDNEIKNGGVRVETSNGIVDATIETQLAIIEKALKTQEEG